MIYNYNISEKNVWPPDRDVDKKHPGPVEIINDVTAEGWAESRAQHDAHAEYRRGNGPLLGRERVE